MDKTGTAFGLPIPSVCVIRARERPMPTLVNKIHPALKHGGYAATAILPGENRADFEKLHQSLIAELAPVGALEDDIIATMARFVWRKQNLATFRIAELARNRYSAIRSRKLPNTYSSMVPPGEEVKDPAQRGAAIRAAEDEARKQLGDIYELVEIGKTATVDCLLQGLEVEERLDAMIDKCLKRLLFLRGLKSLSTASSSAPPQPIPEPQRIPGPTRAA
jgi:hypothetical protein